MIVWMYYETDGDSGYYGVRLFASETAAQRYREKQRDGQSYGRIKSVKVQLEVERDEVIAVLKRAREELDSLGWKASPGGVVHAIDTVLAKEQP